MANFFWKIFSKVDNFVRKVFDEIVAARALIVTENFLQNALHRWSGICVCSVQDQSDSKWLPLRSPAPQPAGMMIAAWTPARNKSICPFGLPRHALQRKVS